MQRAVHDVGHSIEQELEAQPDIDATLRSLGDLREAVCTTGFGAHLVTGVGFTPPLGVALTYAQTARPDAQRVGL